MDASVEMVARAERPTGRGVLHRNFKDMVFEAEFDGIWACASLLHVPRSEMADVFGRFVRALEPGGIWYLSFKLGDSERIKDGRLFNDQTEESLTAALSKFGALESVGVGVPPVWWTAPGLRRPAAGRPFRS